MKYINILVINFQKNIYKILNIYYLNNLSNFNKKKFLNYY